MLSQSVTAKSRWSDLSKRKQAFETVQNVPYWNTFSHRGIDERNHFFQFGMRSRDHNYRQGWIPLLEPCRQFQAVHSRHFVIQDDRVNLLFLVLKYVKCVAATAGG